jgi:hypothetical protein
MGNFSTTILKKACFTPNKIIVWRKLLLKKLKLFITLDYYVLGFSKQVSLFPQELHLGYVPLVSSITIEAWVVVEKESDPQTVVVVWRRWRSLFLRVCQLPQGNL